MQLLLGGLFDYERGADGETRVSVGDTLSDVEEFNPASLCSPTKVRSNFFVFLLCFIIAQFKAILPKVQTLQHDVLVMFCCPCGFETHVFWLPTLASVRS